MIDKSKVKTRAELQVFKIEKDHWIQPYSIIYYQLKEEWYPLEEAQKLESKIQDLEIWNKKLRGKLETEPDALASQLVKMTNKAIEAEAKIAEANKILDEVNLNYEDAGDCLRVVCLVDSLREVLQK